MSPQRTKEISVGDVVIGGARPFVLIAGPCVIEDEVATLEILDELKVITSALDIPLIFKASYDKANRTSADSYRGPGITKGLEILANARSRGSVPVLTDVHCTEDCRIVADVVDCIQIPAFLSRQTDLLIAAGETNKPVNIKKGQFMAPSAMTSAIKKIKGTGNDNILLTERGVSFGYNNLVVDYRSLPIMRSFGYPVVFDATHSVQLPSAKGEVSGGDRDMVAYLARAAVAVGVDALFLEVHPDPDKALSDGPNSLALKDLGNLLKELKELDDLTIKHGQKG
ncbi:MAG: 3-deoxy-8-phosphooctulonate synthase [Deltaproteobacteria bacterium]|nr:3-deoxy-8-phosphooctulonate synthase [Deltaproteobacteria bacterium]